MGRIDTIVDWMLTERCNLNCYYCLQNADTRKAECGPVGRFAENVRPDNFLFINASVHYPYRKQHMEPFVRHFRQLREKGFFIYATVVMIPAEFDEIVGFIREYQRQGLILLPKLMRGIERGQRYPESYGETQNDIMRRLIAICM